MKRILCLIFVIALCSCMLFACSDSNEDESNNAVQNEPVDYGSATVFAPGDKVQIIAPGAESNDFAFYLNFHLRPMVRGESGSGDVYMGSQFTPVNNREIVIGWEDESRPATVSAYKHLNRLERDSYFEMRYAIYASSGTIAIAYDVNEYTNLQVLDLLEKDFIEKYIVNKEYIAFPEGLIASGVYNLIDEQEELDLIQLGEEWNALEEAVGVEAADAFRLLYTMYDDRMVEWAANLYDPGVGGFYTCTSGRDGAEFGPDAEGTVQILRFFASSGMLKNLSTEWTEFIPERMQQQMIYFGKSLQHTNGYFYHPQWSKEDVDAHLSRRGRDLGWATSLLSELNSAPPYKAANGKAGDGVTADEYWQSLVDAGLDLGPKPYSAPESPNASTMKEKGSLTASLGVNVQSAIYDVILTADDNPDDPEVDSSTEYLNSYTAYINYLLTKMAPGFDSNPYSMGNQMNATKSQIGTKSDELEKKYGKYVYTEGDEASCTSPATALLQVKVNTDDDKSNDLSLANIYKLFSDKNMKEMTHFMLNEKINPEIGLWGKTSEKNPTGTEFLFTNGYFKTIGLYSEWGYAYPAEYIPQAADALMKGLLGSQPSTTNICEVYNIWSAIGFLKTNLKLLDKDAYATDEQGNILTDKYGKEILLKTKVTEDVNKILKENMAAAVINTYNKVSGYKQPDGGFDHAYERTSGGYATQQGLPTGLRLNDQSNIDATCIGSTGLTRSMFTALGLSSYKPSLHTESDWMRAIQIFMDQDPVIKYSYGESDAATEYHDYEADIPGSVHLKYTNNNVASNTFTQVNLNGNGVGVLNKVDNSAQAYLDWKPNSISPVANTAYFETKVMFKDIVAAKDRIELRLYNGTTASGTRIYSLYFYLDTSKGTVSICPSDETNKKVVIGNIGEWLTIKFMYCEETTVGDTTIPACFKLYVNGAEKPVLVDRSFENGEAISASNVGFSRFITMKAFLGKIYLDDTRFAREKLEIANDEPTHGIVAPEDPSTPSLPSTGCTLIDKNGVLTFDGLTAFPVNYTNGFIVSNSSQSNWKGYFSVEKEGENTFLRINDLYKTTGDIVDAGQPILTIAIPSSIEKKDTLVVEMKLRVSAFADGSINNKDGFLDLTFRTPNPSNPTAVQRVYQTFFGDNMVALNSDTANGVKNATVTGEWFTLKLEYTVSGDSKETGSYNVKSFVNGTQIQESTSAPASDKVSFGATKDITQVAIIASRDFVGQVDVDDIVISYK